MLFYQQTDGTAMGGPASSTTAEIYMQAYEQTAISTAPHPPKVLEQFVDDLLLHTVENCFENVCTRKTFFITSTIFL